MLSNVSTQAFRDAMEESGLLTREPLIADSLIHRFHVEGDKPGSKNGWYILFGDVLPAGAFGSWKTGQKGCWCAKEAKSLSPQERAEYRRRMEQAHLTREAEEQARRKQAAEKAAAIWNASLPAPDSHPYLVRKGVRSHGVKFYKEALVIPVRDTGAELHSLQFINGDGKKRFLSGGRKHGCFFIIGSPLESVCVCEGFATGASINESTGFPVAVAFDAGNLLPVTKALRAKFPQVKIILCADNDAHTPGNPGLTKAREAALAVDGLLAVPPVPGDFNDFIRGAQR
jgi:putative DNA primase/helicase